MGKPRFIPGEYTKAPWAGLQGPLIHEYDEWGSHRLTHNGIGGQWANWGNVATFKIKDRLFRAYTDYEDGLNEIEEVIAVLPRSLYDLYQEE